MCKVLCLLIASANLLMMAMAVYTIVQHADDQPLYELFISPCLANMVLAVLLVIGIVTEEISLLRLFKIFHYAQLVFALLMVVYGHRFFETHEAPYLAKLCFTFVFVVCAIEVSIVSATIAFLRKKANPIEGMVVYMPVARTV
ncbi:uncharacterized protein LOC128722695 isoform X2 [Anopheles nili]|uniref:uncharacterized protein LOC128722695 isoform X2 n=1 Tax=Anopheles nili TaxID=185578 RepID=UPI00237A5112|nr:uncharacterized protein LOC128722695 isoform X2 [Anopheles nili]